MHVCRRLPDKLRTATSALTMAKMGTGEGSVGGGGSLDQTGAAGCAFKRHVSSSHSTALQTGPAHVAKF